MGLQVLLYWPNVIGYIRIGCVLAAGHSYQAPALFVCLYSVNIVLDGMEYRMRCFQPHLAAWVDGWVARRLDLSSRFGAWLDVVVDNLGRGMLWSRLYEWGWLVSALEWCVFVCNHSSRGDQWKTSFTSSPPFVRSIMANGFRTPLGMWTVTGLHCLPLWLYGCQGGLLVRWLALPPWIQNLGTLLMVSGRLLALPVELWCIWTHVRYLTSAEDLKTPSVESSRAAL